MNILQQPQFLIRNVNLCPSDIINNNSKVRNLSTTGFDEIKSLPLFTYPTTSIIGNKNIDLFNREGIRVIIPQEFNLQSRISYSSNGVYSTYSSTELNMLFIRNELDISNMSQFMIYINISEDSLMIESLLKNIKSRYNNIHIMTGPIQNPELFSRLVSICDYISIGNSYLESSDLFHVNIISLLQECINRRNTINSKTRIIVDDQESCIGFSNMIKTLALGADYLMLGEDLCSVLEANGLIWKSTNLTKSPLSETELNRLQYINNLTDERLYRSFSNDRNNMINISFRLIEYLSKFKQSLETCLLMTNCENITDLHNSKAIALCTY